MSLRPPRPRGDHRHIAPVKRGSPVDVDVAQPVAERVAPWLVALGARLGPVHHSTEPHPANAAILAALGINLDEDEILEREERHAHLPNAREIAVTNTAAWRWSH